MWSARLNRSMRCSRPGLIARRLRAEDWKIRNTTDSTEANLLAREVDVWPRQTVLAETPENRGDLSHNLGVGSILEFTGAEYFFRIGMNNDEPAFQGAATAEVAAVPCQ